MTEVNAQPNNMQTVLDRFIKNLGSGVSCGTDLSVLMHDVANTRDTTVVARAIYRAEKKSDDQAASTVKLVTGQVFPGAKITKNEGKPPTIKIKGIEADTDALERIKGAAERKLSIRHATYRKAVKPPVEEAEEKPFDAKAWAERAKKAHPGEVEAMIAALQALRGGE